MIIVFWVLHFVIIKKNKNKKNPEQALKAMQMPLEPF